MKIEVITDALTIVGEGPVWDDRRKKLYMTDILGKCFRTVDLKTGSIEDTILPQQIGFVFLGENNEIYCGAQDGVYEITDGEFEPVCVPEKLKGNRFNDGKVGPDGRMYGGTISYDFSSAAHSRIIKEENLSGALFAVKPGVKGKKVNRFVRI